MDVVAVEAELKFQRFEPRLRAITGFWKQLEALRTAALANTKLVPQYRKLLEQGIGRVQEAEAKETPYVGEELSKACEGYWAFYRECRERVNAADHESRRQPSPLEEWVARWLPEEWNVYRRAFEWWLDQATPAALEQLKTATSNMMAAYVGDEAVDRRGETPVSEPSQVEHRAVGQDRERPLQEHLPYSAAMVPRA